MSHHCHCACHTADVTISIKTRPCCKAVHDGDQPPRPVPPPPPKGDPTGKIPDPPPGTPRDPWDILQVFIKNCGGETPPPRKDSYLPYLVVRANPGDRGQRPLPPGTCFWESPDILVMPNQPAAGAPAVPANLGGVAQAGAPNTVFAHVWNLGHAPAFDVRVEFYWFNPTLGIEEADANLIGFTYVSLGNRDSPRSHALVACPVDWVPTFLNGGHECLVVRAFSPMADPLRANGFNASLNRHVGQRNIAVLQGQQAQAQPLVFRVAPGHSVHDAVIETVTLQPASVPWMQLLTGRRDPGVKPPRLTPLVGTTAPAAALDPGSPRPNLGGIPAETLAQLVASRHQFKRAEDPLEITLVARAAPMAADEAHVVRVMQRHDKQLVGGYTTILLP